LILAGIILTVTAVSVVALVSLRDDGGERLALSALRSVRSSDKQPNPSQFEDELKKIAAKFGARPRDVKVTPSWRGSAQRWTVLLPLNQSLLKCNLAVTKGVGAAGGKVLDAYEGSSKEHGRFLTMKVAFAEKHTHTITFRRSREVAPALRASMAVVIDDLGYGNDNLLEEFLALDYPVTFSVIPGYRGSRKAHDAVVARGRDVLLHLPMEPHGYPGVDPGKNPILVDLSEGEIRDRMGKHLGNLPKACGVSNHMGTLATQDPEVMRAVLKMTKERGLFFLDGRTTPRSVGKKVAEEVGVVCLENNIFLDTGKKDEKSVRKLFEKAEKIALAKGRVVVTGHLNPGTLKALKNKLPGLDKKGIKLVPLSALARTPSDVL
jgi:polysaccharide deacetylase 2 family uncharacterized protein YibQ